MTLPDGDPHVHKSAESQHPREQEGPISERIRKLLLNQPYGVLCTQSQSQPYGSLVAIASSDDLRTIVFSTPVTTRKYRLLTECEHVALVVDTRSSCPDDMMATEAVTVTGHAHLVGTGSEFEKWAELLIARHPHLSNFVKAESTALFRIDVVRCFHVWRFQEVYQWVPGDPS